MSYNGITAGVPADDPAADVLRREGARLAGAVPRLGRPAVSPRSGVQSPSLAYL